MRRRSIRSRADARIVAHRVTIDADLLWRAVRHEGGRSPIHDDEILPIHALRREARAVARLLGRRNNHRS